MLRFPLHHFLTNGISIQFCGTRKYSENEKKNIRKALSRLMKLASILSQKKALRFLTCPQLQQHFANLSLPLFLGYVQFSWDLKLQDEERITNTNSILCL